MSVSIFNNLSRDFKNTFYFYLNVEYRINRRFRAIKRNSNNKSYISVTPYSLVAFPVTLAVLSTSADRAMMEGQICHTILQALKRRPVTSTFIFIVAALPSSPCHRHASLSAIAEFCRTWNSVRQVPGQISCHASVEYDKLMKEIEQQHGKRITRTCQRAKV